MIILIDNYDSFTWNLWHFMSDLGADVKTIRNDAMTAGEILALDPAGIVLSPGPATPDKAGICMELIKAVGKTPVLGVCLGHQAVAAAYGAKITRLDPPVHGKLSYVHHDSRGIFSGCETPIAATRYHSLAIAPETLPDCLAVTATTESGVIMGIAHRDHHLYGVQFHPESIASECGYRILSNFLSITGSRAAKSNDQIERLEAQLLNLSSNYPEHIHD